MNSRKDFNNIVQSLTAKNIGYKERTVAFPGGVVKLFYIKQLIDTNALVEYILKPIVESASRFDLDAQKVMERVIFAEDLKLDRDEKKIENYLLEGNVIILFSNSSDYIVANIKKVEKRPVAEPELTYTQHSPRDCFVENLDTNLSLIRYRLKDKNIRFDELTVGKKTKTRIVVSYLEDTANPDIVTDIKRRIQAIDTDAIIDSGEVQNFLTNKKNSLLPQMGTIERSDDATERILEGRVLILVDGSNLALSAPRIMTEFLYSCDDRYDNRYFGIFMRLLRYAAFFISFTFSAFYIGMEAFHSDAMPASYILLLAQMRSKVPFSALVGVIILEFIVELLREALVRVPKQIGPAIGIVGAIIIGQAAIAAGLFTPVLLIIVSLELLASFAIPDYTLMNTFRILKILIIALTGMLGFFGFTLGIILILAKLASTDAFGVPYLAPYAPFNWYDFKRTIIFSRATTAKRQQYLRTQNDARSKVAREDAKKRREKGKEK